MSSVFDYDPEPPYTSKDLSNSGRWIKDGKYIDIKEMDDIHLLNAYKKFGYIAFQKEIITRLFEKMIKDKQ